MPDGATNSDSSPAASDDNQCSVRLGEGCCAHWQRSEAPCCFCQRGSGNEAQWLDTLAKGVRKGHEVEDFCALYLKVGGTISGFQLWIALTSADPDSRGDFAFGMSRHQWLSAIKRKYGLGAQQSVAIGNRYGRGWAGLELNCRAVNVLH